MTDITLIFPHQLFLQHPALVPGRPVVLVADSLFFADREFPLRLHAQRLTYQRATLQLYRDRLVAAGYRVASIDYSPDTSGELAAWLQQHGTQRVHACALVDDVLERRTRAAIAAAGAEYIEYSSPGFLLDQQAAGALLGTGRRFFHASFYEKQRKQLGILVNAAGEPVGGAWSFDTENRKKLPKNISIPGLPPQQPHPAWQAAADWTQVGFTGARGSIGPGWLPLNHEQAAAWLDHFLAQRLAQFGPYEDAIDAEETHLFHSMLAPLMNIGLLTPRQILDRALAHAAQHPELPLASLEGFIRQIIGWREFVRAVYERAGRRQRTTNFFGFQRQVPAALLAGQTGLPPVDTAMRRLQDWAWCHHIERLMILGNILLLLETDPDAVYGFFMEHFIDSYDWVMVPNVYGMSQYADGGLMTTKPYISSSAYIRRMSSYPGGDWEMTWDALFWRFVGRHRRVLAANARLGLMVKQYDRLQPERRDRLLRHADCWIRQLDSQPAR